MTAIERELRQIRTCWRWQHLLTPKDIAQLADRQAELEEQLSRVQADSKPTTQH